MQGPFSCISVIRMEGGAAPRPLHWRPCSFSKRTYHSKNPFRGAQKCIVYSFTYIAPIFALENLGTSQYLQEYRTRKWAATSTMIPCGPIDVSVVKFQNIRWACPTEGKISRSRIPINIEWSLIPYVQILIDITHGETRALTFMKALGVSITHAKKKHSDSGSYIMGDYNSSNFVHIVCITQKRLHSVC